MQNDIDDITMRNIILFLALAFALKTSAQEHYAHKISPTRYDYTQVAQQITAGCDSKYKQAYAIYRWLCDNISYDTSYNIYTADECWDNRRGVCQAYSELFYRLAEAVGLKAHIITGLGKTYGGRMEKHAWIFAIVEGESSGILIDPTWGAGSVDNGTFIRNENDDSWFHVSPYWNIFTHYPENETYQLLPHPISRQQFNKLPPIGPAWGKLGFDAQTTYDRCMAGDTDLPKVYNSGMGIIYLNQVPEQQTLRIGTNYRFAVQKLQPCELAIILNQTAVTTWQQQDDIYYVDFVPTEAGELNFGFRLGNDRSYTTVLEYNVARPTASDMARLEAANPTALPEISGLRNFSPEMLEKYAIDTRKLLAGVRNGSINALPEFYKTDGQCTLENIPLDGTLQCGQSYTFTLRPRNGIQWALVNGNTWHKNWTTDPETGSMTMTIVPDTAGTLVLAVQLQPNGSYEYCLCYQVR